jgi:NAD(P)H-dependent flavin oxidoreductase YrpB (nitropropane dioxygenase family)
VRRREDPPVHWTMAKRNSAQNRTRVSNKLGIEYPIIQGPLGGFSSPAPHLEAVGVSKTQFSPYKPHRFEDQVRVPLDDKVPAFSFIYGIPPKEILEQCHRQGTLTIGTAMLSSRGFPSFSANEGTARSSSEST